MAEAQQTPVKDHVYDGWFYRHFIDPSLAGIRRRIGKLVPEGSKVLDVGCGSGDQLLYLAPQIEYGLGVELSQRMIQCSQRQAKRRGIANCSFELRDAAHLDHLNDGKFDVAMGSMVIHEMPEASRLPVLTEMKRLGKTIILADWIYPQPSYWKKAGTNIVEWAAGREHYAGFRSFMAAGGIPPLLNTVGLEILETQITSKGTIQLWVCKPHFNKPHI